MALARRRFQFSIGGIILLTALVAVVVRFWPKEALPPNAVKADVTQFTADAVWAMPSEGPCEVFHQLEFTITWPSRLKGKKLDVWVDAFDPRNDMDFSKIGSQWIFEIESKEFKRNRLYLSNLSNVRAVE